MWNKDYCPICRTKLEILKSVYGKAYSSRMSCPIINQNPYLKTHFLINHQDGKIVYESLTLETFSIDSYPAYDATNIYQLKNRSYSFIMEIPYLQIDYDNLDKVREKLRIYTLFS